MADKQHKGPRPLVIVLERSPLNEPGLAQAVTDDLLELIQFTRLRAETAATASEAAKKASAHDGPVLLTFSDVPALPPDAVDGALEELDDLEVIVGPCADGSTYLLGLAPHLDADFLERLIVAAAESLDRLISAAEDAELETATLPPWFRLANAKDLSFANSLTRLSLMNDDGDMEFLADRLKHWLTQRKNA